MSLWSRLIERISALGESLVELFSPSHAEDSDGFAMAVVALGAKMAKADGRVTRDEVIAFREIFVISDKDLPAVGRFFDLARQDTAGFELYAARISRMFEGRPVILETLLEGLFHIARADGVIDSLEDAFLRDVARIFAIDEGCYERIRLRNLPDGDDPWRALGIEPDTPFDEVRGIWRRLAAEHHPDRLVGAGLPLEARKLAEHKLATINAAYEEIRAVSQPGRRFTAN